ncbi:MAG: formate dehydrogenase subunit gamma [Vicinamibacterales bacterium]
MNASTATPVAHTTSGTAPGHTVHVRRFDARTRTLHIVVMTTFLVLSATGLPLLFSDAPWARLLASFFGGFQGAGFVHRVAGATLLGAVVYHVVDVFYRAFVKGERGIFWGPTSMVPQPRDFQQFGQQMLWFFGKADYPKYEQFTYWEKFDYWAVLWGTALMGAAGLILWFPEAASHILPGWMFNVALFVHGAEAALAIGFIFVVHFFNGHLRPGKFPMDTVIFTGVVPEAELRHERAGQYARLVAEGSLEALAADAPDEAALRRGRIIGTIGLTVGLAMVAIIAFAVLR